jgi:hypothetical protein
LIIVINQRHHPEKKQHRRINLCLEKTSRPVGTKKEENDSTLFTFNTHKKKALKRLKKQKQKRRTKPKKNQKGKKRENQT